jgi:hypothetical protein
MVVGEKRDKKQEARAKMQETRSKSQDKHCLINRINSQIIGC